MPRALIDLARPVVALLALQVASGGRQVACDVHERLWQPFWRRLPAPYGVPSRLAAASQRSFEAQARRAVAPPRECPNIPTRSVSKRP
jgi:hypothetical protein